jgi:murein endopeptidase
MAIPFFTILILAAQWGPFPTEKATKNLHPQDHQPPCSNSKLLSGVLLPDNPSLYKKHDPENAWGTPRMISALTYAAAEVKRQVPDVSPLVIGDISREGGGLLQGHKSHRGGSDADIGLYYKNGNKHKNGFLYVTSSAFDLKTNWILIRAFLESNDVERILVDQAMVNALRRYVVKIGAMTQKDASYTFPAKMEQKIWLRTKVVHHSPGHKHHYHVRVFCHP